MYQQHNILANMPTFGKNNSNKNQYGKDQHSTYTIKSGCFGKYNIFPIHQMKACQLDWQKLMFPEKSILF